jgi:hypothetical protein
VVDIDGVLADAGHRQHHLDVRPRDWAAFFAEVGGDAPIAEGLALVRELAADHEVVLLSGRPESTRADTEAWLASCGVPYTRLVLRPDADRRPAAAMKAAALLRMGGPGTVALVVDDDPSVIAGLEGLGYPVRLFALH